MTAAPTIHIVVMQPEGYLHSLGFLDQARYVRYQLRRLGVQVSLGKNRLREDAVNIVFGAHLGFADAWKQRHACVFVNLEQLGEGGAQLSPEYLRLLRQSAVVDYDPANIAAYGAAPADVPLLPFWHAPYLADTPPLPHAERPIDLLFFGSMNQRRRVFIDRIEACGVQVARFDQPIYGPERDQFIRQAKAVLNCHFYTSSRFEQVRVSHCLSLGTPVISERLPATRPPAAFEDAVCWLRDDEIKSFFSDRFATPAFEADAAKQLAAFARHDPIEAYADLVGFAAGFQVGHRRSAPTEPWRPRQMNLGSGRDYLPGWLNVDVIARAEPDLLLDLGGELSLPLQATTCFGAPVEIGAASLQFIQASNVLEHVPDLPALMGNLLELLEPGGLLEVEVPYEKALTAWQDPTHVRAMNENSWRYYTDWFWYLGWFDYRFELVGGSWVDEQLQQCAKEGAAFMRLRLRKIATTPQERNHARMVRADFGGIHDDPVPPHARLVPEAVPAASLIARTNSPARTEANESTAAAGSVAERFQEATV